MKRYVCIATAALALALTGAGTATASIELPAPLPTQEASGGDQKVEEQENEAEVSHEQSNWNVASPPVAIAVLGDAEASNEQKNVNVSDTEIKQENEVEQEQSSTQQSGTNGCCNGQSQAGEQQVYGGDQKVEEQENEAKVEHEQTNVNVLSPPVAIAVLGDAEASNEQTNVNHSETDVKQENEVEQEQSSSQRSGGSSCCDGTSRAGEQKASGGDQKVEEQENEAEVSHEQSNWNVASPPVAIAVLGDAEASNEQTNVNHSETDVKQENEVEQEQSSSQRSGGSGCCGQGQAGEQKVYGGDQKVEEQENEAKVEHEQTNVNVLSPPVALGVLGKADAENEQTNVNYSKTWIEQDNEVEQKQTSEQWQAGGGCCRPAPAPKCSSSCEPKKEYGRTPGENDSPNGGRCCESGEQKVYGGDQKVEEQENEAKVEHEQTNVNVLSPPVALGVLGKADAENEQTNVNYSKTWIEQDNEVEQKQTSEQWQAGGGCCRPAPAPKCSSSCEPKKEYGRTPGENDSPNGGRCCESGEQKVYGGDQKVEEQENEAKVEHEQTNVNVLSPPVALGVLGKADAENEQTNVNYSKTWIEQDNEVEQKQTSEQWQAGGGCCRPAPAPKCSSSCEPKKEYGRTPGENDSPNGGRCCESGEQKVYGGDQKVEEQENEAKVEHEQTNVNVLSPPVALGVLGKADAENEQTNVNYSKTWIEQDNEVEQKQTSYQRQSVVDMCKGLIYR